MAFALQAALAALLLAGAACTEARDASHDRSGSTAFDVNVTVDAIANGLYEIHSAKPLMQELVNRVTEAILELMGTAFERNASLDQQLRYHVVDECWFVQALAEACTYASLASARAQLQHLSGDVDAAAAQVRRDAALAGQMLAVKSNLSEASRAVARVMQLTEDVARLLVAQGSAAVSEQVHITTQTCQQFIDDAHDLTLQNKTDGVGINREVDAFLSEAAKNAIVAGKYYFRNVKAIAENSKNLLNLERRVLIETTLATTQNQTDIIQTATKLQKMTQSSIQILLIQVRSDLQYIKECIISYKKGLEIQVEIAKYSVNIFNGRDKLNLTELVEEIFIKKEILLQNVTSIIDQMFQIGSYSGKLNDTDMAILIDTIKTDSQTMKECAQNQDIKEIKRVIMHVQYKIQIVLQYIRNSTEELDQQLCIQIEKLLDNIQNTLEEMQQFMEYTKKKIQTFLEIFCKNTTSFVQNANEFLNNILNQLQDIITQIKNTESNSTIIKYITIIAKNALSERQLAHQIFTDEYKTLENSIINVETKLFEIVIQGRIGNETDTVAYIEQNIHVTLNKFMYVLSNIISGTLEIQFTIGQELRNEINIISIINNISGDVISTLNIQALLNEVVEMQYIVIQKTMLVIAPLQYTMEYILTLNYTATRETVLDIMAQTQTLVDATENENNLKVEKIINNLIITIKKLISIIGTFTYVPANVIDQVQSLSTNLTTVKQYIDNIGVVVASTVRPTVTNIIGFLQQRCQSLLTKWKEFNVKVQTWLTKVTETLDGHVSASIRQTVQKILQVTHEYVTQLQASFGEISSIDIIVTKIVTMIISYNESSSASALLVISTEIRGTLLKFVNEFQEVLIYNAKIFYSLTEVLYNQVYLFNFFNNTGTVIGSLDMEIPLRKFQQITNTAHLQVELISTRMLDLTVKYASLNSTVINQFIVYIRTQIQILGQAKEKFNYLQIVGILLDIQSSFQVLIEPINITGLPQDFADEVQIIFAHISTVLESFFNFKLEVTTAVSEVFSGITGCLHRMFQSLLTKGSEFIEVVQTWLNKNTESLHGQLSASIRQIVQIILQIIEQYLKQLQARFEEISSMDIIVTKIVTMIISYNETSSATAILDISNEIRETLSAWVYGFQREFSNGAEVIYNAIESFWIQARVFEYLTTSITDIVLSDTSIEAMLIQVEHLKYESFLQVKFVSMLIDDVIKNAKLINNTILNEIIVDLTAQLKSVVEAIQESEYLQIVQVFQEFLYSFELFFNQLVSLSGVSETFVVQVQTVYANLTIVQGLFNNIESFVVNAIYKTLFYMSGILQRQFQLLLQSCSLLSFEEQALEIKLTGSFSAEFTGILTQLLRMISELVRTMVVQLQKLLDLSSEDVVLSRIVTIFLSYSYNESNSKMVILEITKNVKVLIDYWVGRNIQFVSFYMEYLFTLSQIVSVKGEIVNTLEAYLSGLDNDIADALEQAFLLRNTTLQNIVEIMDQLLLFVSSFSSLGVAPIGDIVNAITSQVNSTLHSIQVGSFGSIVIEVQQLSSDIQAKVNEISKAGQISGDSESLSNVIKQLNTFEENISNALLPFNKSINIITIIVRESASRLTILVKNSASILSSLGLFFIRQGNVTLQYLSNTTDELTDVDKELHEFMNIGKLFLDKVTEFDNNLSKAIGSLDDKIVSNIISFIYNINLNATDIHVYALKLRRDIFIIFSNFVENVESTNIDILEIAASAYGSMQIIIDRISNATSDASKYDSNGIEKLLKRVWQLQKNAQTKMIFLGTETLRVVGELESFVSSGLLSSIRSQAEYALNVSARISDIDEIVLVLENLLSNLKEAEQYGMNASNNVQGNALEEAQRLRGELQSLAASCVGALDAVRDVASALADVVEKAIVKANFIFQRKIGELRDGAQLLIDSGEAALETHATNAVSLGGEFFQRLVATAQSCIDVGREAGREAEGIRSEWNASLGEMKQEMKSLILQSLGRVLDIFNIKELLESIIDTIDNHPNWLLSQVRSKIQTAMNLIFTKKSFLENVIQIRVKLINLFQAVLSNIQSGDTYIDFEILLYNLTQVQMDSLHDAAQVIDQILNIVDSALQNNNTVNFELLISIKSLAASAKLLIQSGNVSVFDQLLNLLEQLESNIEAFLKHTQDAYKSLEGGAQRAFQVLISDMINVKKNINALLITVQASVVVHTLFVVQETFGIAYSRVMEQAQVLTIRGQYLIQEAEKALENTTLYFRDIGPEAASELKEVAITCIALGQAAVDEAKGLITNFTVPFVKVIQLLVQHSGQKVDNITQMIITIKETSSKELTTLVSEAYVKIDIWLNLISGAKFSLRSQFQITCDLLNWYKLVLANFNSTNLLEFLNVSLNNVEKLENAAKYQVSVLVSQIPKIVDVAGAESGVVDATLLATIKSVTDALSQLPVNSTSSSIKQLQEPLQKLLTSVQNCLKQAQNSSLILEGDKKAFAQNLVASLLKAVNNITEALSTVEACVIADALLLVHETVAKSFTEMQDVVQKLIDKATVLIDEAELTVKNATLNADNLGAKVAEKMLKAGQDAIAAGQEALEKAKNIAENWSVSVSSSLKASLSGDWHSGNIAQTISQISENISAELVSLLDKVRESVDNDLKIIYQVKVDLWSQIGNVLDTIVDGAGTVRGVISDVGNSLFSNFAFNFG